MPCNRPTGRIRGSRAYGMWRGYCWSRSLTSPRAITRPKVWAERRDQPELGPFVTRAGLPDAELVSLNLGPSLVEGASLIEYALHDGVEASTVEMEEFLVGAKDALDP